MVKELIQMHVLATRLKIPKQQAIDILEQSNEPWVYLAYHHCCECPIYSSSIKSLPDEFECPECQEQIWDADITWDVAKYLYVDRFGKPIEVECG